MLLPLTCRGKIDPPQASACGSKPQQSPIHQAARPRGFGWNHDAKLFDWCWVLIQQPAPTAVRQGHRFHDQEPSCMEPQRKHQQKGYEAVGISAKLPNYQGNSPDTQPQLDANLQLACPESRANFKAVAPYLFFFFTFAPDQNGSYPNII